MSWTQQRARETAYVRKNLVYGLELACVVFGIGNSLVLFGRKQHCAELVRAQRGSPPAPAADSEWARCCNWEVSIVPGRIGSHTR